MSVGAKEVRERHLGMESEIEAAPSEECLTVRIRNISTIRKQMRLDPYAIIARRSEFRGMSNVYYLALPSIGETWA